MKKFASVFAVFLVVLGVASVSVIATLNVSAQQGNPFSNQPSKTRAVFKTESVSRNTIVESLPDSAFSSSRLVTGNPEEAELIKLRSVYANIDKAKAELMTRDELREAVGNASDELAELRAKKELESAVGKLKTIVEQYPKSDAAREAKRLIDAAKRIDEGSGTTGDAVGDEAPVRRKPKRADNRFDSKDE